MSAIARPLPTKLAAAIVAAGVTTAGVAVEMPEIRHQATTVAAEVTNASFITDLLWRYGDLVASGAAGLGVTSHLLTTLPLDLARTGLAAFVDPLLTPSLISWLVQQYANPSDNFPFDSYARQFKAEFLESLVDVVPLLGPVLAGAINAAGNAFGDVMAFLLPDVNAGYQAILNLANDGGIGQLLYTAEVAAILTSVVAKDVLVYLAYLPAKLEATFEAVLFDFGNLPGFVSNLAYDLLGTEGLVGTVVEHVIAALGPIPAPFDEIVEQVKQTIFEGIDAVLSPLPAPISPWGVPDESEEQDPPQDDNEAQQAGRSAGDATADDAAGSGTGAGDTAEDGTEDITPPAEDVAAARSARASALKVKSGNKFTPGQTDPAADDAAGGGVGDEVAAEPEDAGTDAPADEGAAGETGTGEGAGGSEGSSEE